MAHAAFFRAAALSLVFGTCVAVTASAQAPVTAQIPIAERQQAARQHPQLLEEFGGAYQGPQARFVADVGERIAAAAGAPGQCTFTLVNTDVVNAFAVPGCYVYVTRGLLAIVNSEDELAFVLGHEVGHIVARHSQSRQNRSTVAGLGAILLAAIAKRDDIGKLATQGAQLYTLGFSRSQEFEADDIGIRYMERANYDATAAMDMLDDLHRHDQLQAKSRGRNDAEAVPAWGRTHPVTADRIARARTRVAALPGSNPRQADRYLRAVDGMLWGDDPTQGFVLGRTFAHPQMRIAFEAPPGFGLVNSTRAVLVQHPNGLKAQFSGGQAGNVALESYAAQVMRQTVGQTPAQVGQAERTRVNGLEAVVLPARAQSQSGVFDVTVTAYRAFPDAVYHFVTLAPSGQGRAFDPLIRSFRTLSPAEASRLRPRTVRVITARPGDTFASLASRMAVEDFRSEWLAMINNLPANAQIRPGQPIKVIEYAA